MANLTPEQEAQIKTYQVDYTMLGYEKRLFKPQPTPFKSPDEQGITIQGISSNVPISSLSFRQFIKRSGTAKTSFTFLNDVDNNVSTITMTLTLKFGGLTLAIPRWSIYYPDDSDPSNELLESFDAIVVNGSANSIHLHARQSWEAIQGTNDIRHILKVTMTNSSSADLPLVFKGDWLYIGDIVT